MTRKVAVADPPFEVASICRVLPSAVLFIVLAACSRPTTPATLPPPSSDAVHNLRSLGGDVWTRFNSSRDENLWYYRSLANTFLKLGEPRLAAELDRVVSELERLTEQASGAGF